MPLTKFERMRFTASCSDFTRSRSETSAGPFFTAKSGIVSQLYANARPPSETVRYGR